MIHPIIIQPYPNGRGILLLIATVHIGLALTIQIVPQRIQFNQYFDDLTANLSQSLDMEWKVLLKIQFNQCFDDPSAKLSQSLDME